MLYGTCLRDRSYPSLNFTPATPPGGSAWGSALSAFADSMRRSREDAERAKVAASLDPLVEYYQRVIPPPPAGVSMDQMVAYYRERIAQLNAAAAATSAINPPRPATETPSEGSSVLVVYRPDAWSGSALRPSVFVDGQEVVRMRNGRRFMMALPPGLHRIGGNCQGQDSAVVISPGQPAFIRVEMRGAWRLCGATSITTAAQAQTDIPSTSPLEPADVKDPRVQLR